MARFALSTVDGAPSMVTVQPRSYWSAKTISAGRPRFTEISTLVALGSTTLGCSDFSDPPPARNGAQRTDLGRVD